MFLRNKKKLPEMVRPSRSNDSPSSPTMQSMADTTFDATSQQIPQATLTIGASHDDTIGVTIPAHISSTMPASASTVDAAAQSNASFGAQSNQSLWTFDPLNNKNYPYGMSPSFMVGHHTNPSPYSENSNVMRPQFYYPGTNIPSSNPQQSLANASLMALRHQMEDCNHEMVNMLTQQIRTVFNPFIRETHNSYLTLFDQMGRIADFFGAPPARNTPTPQNQNPRPIEGYIDRPNGGIPANSLQQPVVEPQAPRVQERVQIMVQRNQDADHIIRRAQQNNLESQNNIANIVESLLTQNGFNMGLHRPTLCRLYLNMF